MQSIKLSLYYLTIHPLMAIYKGRYYIRQYFYIKEIVSSRLHFHLSRSAAYSNHSKAKLLVATTYTSLAAKLLSDLINNTKSDLIYRREFLALIDLYFLIAIADNFVDNADSQNKVEKINHIFKNIVQLIEDPDNASQVKISVDFDTEIPHFVKEYRDLWKDDYKNEFINVVNSVKKAYLFESSSNSLKKSWQSLYVISRITIKLYETINYFIYKKKIECPYVRKNLYNFAFAGNLIDDWMDYYWTKEDFGTNCFLVELSKHHNLKKPNGIIFNTVTFFSSCYMLLKRVYRVRFSTINYAQHSWIMPSFIMVIVVSSPISIWMHMQEK